MPLQSPTPTIAQSPTPAKSPSPTITRTPTPTLAKTPTTPTLTKMPAGSPAQAISSIETSATNVGKWHNKPFYVELYCKPLTAPCKETYYRLNKGIWTKGTKINIDRDGNTLIEFYSIDVNLVKENTKVAYALLDTQKPLLSQDFIAIPKENSVLLEWGAATDSYSGVQKYVIYKNKLRYGETTELSYIDKNVVSGSKYGYSIAAVDHAGNYSDISPEVFVFFENIPTKETITMTIEYPKPGENVLPEEEVNYLLVQITEGDKPLDQNEIEAELNINGKIEKGSLVLEKDGLYRYDLKEPIKAGDVNLSIKVKGADFEKEQSASFSFVPEKRTDWLSAIAPYLLLIIVVATLSVLAYLLMSLSKYKKEQQLRAKLFAAKQPYEPQGIFYKEELPIVQALGSKEVVVEVRRTAKNETPEKLAKERPLPIKKKRKGFAELIKEKFSAALAITPKKTQSKKATLKKEAKKKKSKRKPKKLAKKFMVVPKASAAQKTRAKAKTRKRARKQMKQEQKPKAEEKKEELQKTEQPSAEPVEKAEESKAKEVQELEQPKEAPSKEQQPEQQATEQGSEAKGAEQMPSPAQTKEENKSEPASQAGQQNSNNAQQ